MLLFKLLFNAFWLTYKAYDPAIIKIIATIKRETTKSTIIFKDFIPEYNYRSTMFYPNVYCLWQEQYESRNADSESHLFHLYGSL